MVNGVTGREGREGSDWIVRAYRLWYKRVILAFAAVFLPVNESVSHLGHRRALQRLTRDNSESWTSRRPPVNVRERVRRVETAAE